MVKSSVLIIEDDDDSRRAIARLFARAQWKVLEAADGDTGVELAVRHRPAVILCDLLRPKSHCFRDCCCFGQQLSPTTDSALSWRVHALDCATSLYAGAV